MRKIFWFFIIFALPIQAFAAIEWTPNIDDKLYDDAEKVFDAEFLSYSTTTDQEPFEGCEKMRHPSMQGKTVGVFRIIAKIQGEVELNKYLHIPFTTVISFNTDCSLNPRLHLFFKKDDRLRVFDMGGGDYKFYYLDPLINDSFVTYPLAERIPVGKYFKDIDNSECAKLFNFFYWRGAVIGFNDGTAHPNELVTRAEFLAILTRTLGMQEDALEAYSRYISPKYYRAPDENIVVGLDKAVRFPDVVGDDWFSRYVALALEKRWINGFADGYFKPGDSITFAQMLKIALRAYEIPIITTVNDHKLDWYAPYVRTAINFSGLKLLDLNTQVTRCQVLWFIELLEREYLKRN